MSDMGLSIPLIAAAFVSILRCIAGIGLTESFRTQCQLSLNFSIASRPIGNCYCNTFVGLRTSLVDVLK